MSAKDNLINVGLLAAGGVAIAAASGVYGKGSRAIRGMRYTLAYGGDNDSTIHVSGTFKPYSKAVESAKKLAKRIGRTVEVREQGYDLVAFVEPSGRVDDGGYGKGSRAKRSAQDVYRQRRMPALDPSEYPAIPGMQGPFRYEGGDVLYYDPREGKYYDRRRDMYVGPPGKGSMTRDGSYEATLMFDADEDDPTVRAQRQLQANPYVPQARPLTAEPPRITSAQGSTARGSSSVLRGMTAKPGTPIPGPSLKTLDERLNLGGEEGKSLKYFMQAGQRQAALDYADELLGGSGIEYIESQQDTMRRREGLSYVNMGDTYDTTLIYDHKTGRFYVGAWGDWVERYPKRFG